MIRIFALPFHLSKLSFIEVVHFIPLGSDWGDGGAPFMIEWLSLWGFPNTTGI